MSQKNIASTAPVAEPNEFSRSTGRQVKDKRHNKVNSDGIHDSLVFSPRPLIFPFKKPDSSQNTTQNTTKDDKANIYEGAEGGTFTLNSGQLRPTKRAVHSKGKYDFLCSYTWVKGTTSTIHVPGNYCL